MRAGSSGLSPRVRGNPSSARRSMLCQRSIPACAGEPQRSLSTWTMPPVYPRVCGGTRSGNPGSLFLLGLSPRVRGNPQRRACLSSMKRSIPACAGEPRQRFRTRKKCRVYPRVCGGTKSELISSFVRNGLSPRVRGNLDRKVTRPVRIGSIPACAGEPRPGPHRDAHTWVYPRVCGGTSKECR